MDSWGRFARSAIRKPWAGRLLPRSTTFRLRPDFPHGLEGRLSGGKAVFDAAFDILHYDDGIIDDDADGEHEPEQRQRVN